MSAEPKPSEAVMYAHDEEQLKTMRVLRNCAVAGLVATLGCAALLVAILLELQTIHDRVDAVPETLAPVMRESGR